MAAYLLRRLVQAVPALRGLARSSGATANRKLPLTPALIQGSLEPSHGGLRRDRHVVLRAVTVPTWRTPSAGRGCSSGLRTAGVGG